MDINLRLCDNDRGEVATRYYISLFLGPQKVAPTINGWSESQFQNDPSLEGQIN